MIATREKWGVVGAGAWGTALAQTLAQGGQDVLVWDRDPLVVDDINRFGQNRKRYPDFQLHEVIRATQRMEQLAAECHIIALAVPSEANADVAALLAGHLKTQHGLVVTSKGLRESDGALLTEVWREMAPDVGNMAVLTGPTFARELMEKRITTFLLAAMNADFRAQIAESFLVDWVRVYEGTDIVGAQVGGAMKNILAVAAGILDGLDMGQNARAAMLTRGLVEMARFAKALGGRESTVWGLAGMGDLLLTATSTLSRNYRFGQMVGRGMSVQEARMKVGTVEGILAARIITVQAQAHGLDLAIVSAVDGILHGDVTPLQAIEYLMKRPRVAEVG